MVPPTSHKVPRVSWYSGSRSVLQAFTYGAFTLCGRLSQNRSVNLPESCMRSMTPACTHAGLGSSAFARRYLRNRISFSSSGYLDVSVPRVPLHTLWIGVWIHEVHSCGFPHSDISGSMDICSSPKLFAAYHVFHRLSVPRHPPCALIRLTCQITLKAVPVIRRSSGKLAFLKLRLYGWWYLQGKCHREGCALEATSILICFLLHHSA